MSDDQTIQLRFHWSQMSGNYTSDVNVLFYEVGSDRHVAEITVPQQQKQTIDLIRTYLYPDTTIDLPATFLDPSTSADERRDMFRAALFKAADS